MKDKTDEIINRIMAGMLPTMALVGIVAFGAKYGLTAVIICTVGVCAIFTISYLIGEQLGA